jgi:hypothetical protein
MLRVRNEFQQAFQRLGLTSCESVIRHFAGNGPLSEAVAIRAAELRQPDGGSLPVFYKQYSYSPPAWKFVGRPSKARCEFQNYEVFARLGVPSAEAIACGEQRDGLGRLRAAFILTRAILNALPLPEFFARHCTNRAQTGLRALLENLLCQLAGWTRQIHDASFFHHDLVWRNILATWSPPTEAKLWWIDCPRGRFDRWSPLRHRRRLKDLASLDKVASQLCTRGERLRFVKLYLGKTRLDAETKKLVRDALNFRRTRWPDDWK